MNRLLLFSLSGGIIVLLVLSGLLLFQGKNKISVKNESQIFKVSYDGKNKILPSLLTQWKFWSPNRVRINSSISTSQVKEIQIIITDKTQTIYKLQDSVRNITLGASSVKIKDGKYYIYIYLNPKIKNDPELKKDLTPDYTDGLVLWLTMNPLFSSTHVYADEDTRAKRVAAELGKFYTN